MWLRRLECFGIDQQEGAQGPRRLLAVVERDGASGKPSQISAHCPAQSNRHKRKAAGRRTIRGPHGPRFPSLTGCNTESAVRHFDVVLDLKLNFATAFKRRSRLVRAIPSKHRQTGSLLLAWNNQRYGRAKLFRYT